MGILQGMYKKYAKSQKLQNDRMKNLGFTLYGITFHKRVIFYVGKSQNINKSARKVRLRDKRHVHMKQCLPTVCQYFCRATVKRLRQWKKVYNMLCCVVLEQKGGWTVNKIWQT